MSVRIEEAFFYAQGFMFHTNEKTYGNNTFVLIYLYPKRNASLRRTDIYKEMSLHANSFIFWHTFHGSLYYNKEDEFVELMLLT